VALALLLGASNFEIGLLAAMPTLTNIFQLLSIWLVRRFANRRLISVACSVFARLPLAVLGYLVFAFPHTASVRLLLFFLFFYYFFGSISGPVWNSGMKDLIPARSLGSYFAKRSGYMQSLNVIFSIVLAAILDYIKRHHPESLLTAYGIMFAVAGIVGLFGMYLLSRVPEPRPVMSRGNLFELFKLPIRNKNFSRLLVFISAWAFAINIATPFFTVFMLTSLQLSLSYVIGLGILSQAASILTIRVWGIFADRYSNKTIIAIGGPLYSLCIIAWCFVGLFNMYVNLLLLILIQIFSGIATSGINLSLTNIGLKLAPDEDAIVYLSSKNVVSAFFSAISPLLGGYLADYFAQRHFNISIEWGGPHASAVFHVVALHQWNFLFLIGAFLALLSLRLLSRIKETGEVEKDTVVRILRSAVRNNLKEYFLIGNLITFHEALRSRIRRQGSRIKKTFS
jgi:MFS family permease